MPRGGDEERGQMPRLRDRCVPTLLNQPVNKTVKLRPPYTSRLFVGRQGRQKIFTRRLVCGEFRQVCNKIGACRAISDSARSQNGLSGLVGECTVDQDNLSGLVRTSTNKELSQDSREQASFPTWRISTRP